MTAFITSLLFVILAEMGDKTQLLAMAFAVRYRWQTVMWGVFAATVFNHLLAVLIGNYLTRLIPIYFIQIAASIAFIIFGLWTLRGDKLSGKENMAKYGPFWTIAIAFFMAEMGDKTQLATITLSAQFDTVLPVWLGSTTGMMLADGLGIIVGIVLGKKIPERTVKWTAAIVFITFGLFDLYRALNNEVLIFTCILGALIIVGAAIYFMSYVNMKNHKKTKCNC